MNINDIDENEITASSDKLKTMYDRQWDLANKYHKIEEINGLLQTPEIPVNINTPRGQARLKDFAWRVSEEVCEAYEARVNHPEDENHLHFWEELSDVFHFLLELAIISDIYPSDIKKSITGESNDAEIQDCSLDNIFRHLTLSREASKPTIEVLLMRFMMEVGCAMNCLKQKPWKQSHQQTDRNKFRSHLLKAFRRFFEIYVYNMDNGAEFLYNTYFKKSLVNDFRIRTNY